MSKKVVCFGAMVVGLLMVAGCGGIEVEFKNPSYTYECVPIIDGESQTIISTTTNKSFSVSAGSHTFNTEFWELGTLVKTGTAVTLDIQDYRSFACYAFHE